MKTSLQKYNFDFEENSKYEIISNTASIVEQLKKIRIKLSFAPGKKIDFTKSTKGYFIKVGMDNDIVLPKTKLERELAKIVFDSPVDQFAKYAKTIKTNTSTSQRLVFFKYIRIVFHYLESRRVESCYGNIYRGAQERFIDARKHDAMGEFSKLEIPQDPIEALKLARYDKFELVKASEFAIAIQYIEAVEMTGRLGAYDLAIMYWEKVVQPFLEKNLRQSKPPSGNNGKDVDFDDSKGLEQKKSEILEQIIQSEKKIRKIKETDSIDRFFSRHNDKINQYYKLDSIQGEIKKIFSQNTNAQEMKQGLLAELSEPFKIYTDQKIPFAELTNRLKREGKKEIKLIEEDLEKISRQKVLGEYHTGKIGKLIKHTSAKRSKSVIFNKNVSLKLKNLFKKIQGGMQIEVDSVGDDIDVESYIDYKIQKSGYFLKSSKVFSGFDIVLAIDESGSMGGKVPIVQRMCATLYDAISGLPNVRITVVGWSGFSDYCTIKKITKPLEIGSIDATGTTPLGAAVWYCQHLIEKMTSPKRLFILITDGQPNTTKDVEIARQGISIMRKMGVFCNGICVGYDNDEFTFFMRKIFGNDFVIIDDYQSVDIFLTNEIAKKIVQSLRMTNFY